MPAILVQTRSFGAIALLVIFVSCSKQKRDIDHPFLIESRENPTSARPPKNVQFTTYTIRAGQHYCDQNSFKSVSVKGSMSFVVKFDNSAIYQTVIAENQYDINKLWGFSEGFDHQYNSARIGWAWNDGALRLYAYSYNRGVRQSQEITSVPIGSDITCSIKLSGSSYIFTVNDISVTQARGVSTTTASGYQLYPYFGGDETAPHTIKILLRSL